MEEDYVMWHLGCLEEKRDVFYVNMMEGWAGLINVVQSRD
jgi:hypothetical protein